MNLVNSDEENTDGNNDENNESYPEVTQDEQKQQEING